MRTVFLDRDGVINENRTDYVKSWDEFVFLPGALAALQLLRERGYQVFVVTNQSGVGRGILSSQELDALHWAMRDAIEGHGGAIADVFYCPHPPEAGCDCRKPRPGLLLQASRRHSCDPTQSYVIGDSLTDVQAGLAVGATPILVLTGLGRQSLGVARLRGAERLAERLAPSPTLPARGGTRPAPSPRAGEPQGERLAAGSTAMHT
ncbi:MAG: D-glycero-beta-D-manno-heptose 1,7-bisphosphate 7-phosphatase, partial [Chloroflexi bacterium]|nr:D-glycero-beta-D-manno-heptose 1,7-bisphosphate 7-phosphatase [Chloroflexota bacterium]